MQAVSSTIHGAGWEGELLRVADARGVVLVCVDAGPLGAGERSMALRRVLGDYGLSTLAVAVPGAQHGGDAAASLADSRAWTTGFGEALAWIAVHDRPEGAAVGLLGEEAAAAAALRVAASHAGRVLAVVTCNGRLLAADDTLARVRAATLMVVSALDTDALAAHREALQLLRGERRLEGIPGVTRALHEPGAFDTIAHLAGSWLRDRLGAALN
ncbi:MAG: hypothetical protein U1E89_12465 [Burkholderiaceae bacterium]